MSHYHDRFKQHAFHNTLSSLVESMDSANLQLTDPAQIDGYARFRRVVVFASRTVDTLDPELVGENALNTLNSVLSKMKAQFSVFISGRSWQQLNAPADELLEQLCRLPRLKFPQGQQAFAAALEDYRTQATMLLTEIKREADKLGQHHNQANQTLGTLEAKFNRFDQQFETQKGRVDALISQKQAEFNQAEQNRNTKFNEQHQQFQMQIGDLSREIHEVAAEFVERARSEFDSLRTQHEKEASATVERLRTKLDEAVKLVGIIGNTGLTGNYQRIANQQTRIADRFRWIAIGCMALAVVFVGIVVFSIGKSNFSWEVAVFRLLGALTFSIPGMYCARESSRHRAVEQRNRRIELELVSLSPYLAELTDEERKKIIAELSGHYFGREPASDEENVLRKLKNIKGEHVLKLLERVAKVVKPT